MAYIDVRNLSINRAGFSNVARTFSDTFNRASGNLGKNWIQTSSPTTPTSNPITTGTYSIGVCTDAIQGVIAAQVGSINPLLQYSGGLICVPLVLNCWGLSQFSEWKMVANDNTGANHVICGPACMLQNSGQQSVGTEQQGLFGYLVEILSDTKAYFVVRGNETVQTTMFSAGATFINGDVVRLEAKVNAGDVTLTLKQNGTTINSFVDNSVGRILSGSPGFYNGSWDNSGGGSMTCQWRNFNGGLL
jgi:hypothetical protein